MKKIITLLLLIGGFACAASAADVTKRIVVVNEITNWVGWDNTIYIHILDHTSWGQEMNYIGSYEGKKVFYFDYTADESVFANSNLTIWIYNTVRNGADQGYNNKNHMVEIKGAYNTDKVFYLYAGDGVQYSPVPLTYYFVTTDGTTKLADLTYNNGELMGTFSTSSNVYGTIAPNYALKDNWAGLRDWSLTISPDGNADVGIDNFSVFNGSLGGSKAFYFTYNSNYDLSFDIFAKTYSISPYFERTLNSAAEGYATFSSIYDVTPDEDLTVKYVSAVDASGNITWTKYTGGIQAGQGVLLEGTAGSTYKFTPSSSASAPSTNFLKPINEMVELSQTSDGKTNYILTNKKADGTTGTLGFYKVNSAGSWCSAGTAYLSTTAPTPARGYFPLWEDATSIESIATECENVNLPVYDLQGRRVTSPQKGLYIVNGKKVVIK